MGPSPAIVHAGLRTAAHAGWRTAAVEAVARVLATPSLWLLGALAFLLRGGIVLLTAPVLVLPSPVALRLLIGDNLTSSGFAPGFYALVGAGAATLTGLVLLGLWLACYAELVSFETFNRRFCRSAAERRGLASAVFVIDLVALFALVGAALPLVAGAVDATYVEITRPSTGGGLYERVLSQLGGPLFLLLAVLVVVEAASATAKRRLLRGALGADAPIPALTALLVGLGRPLARPLSTLGTAALGWLTSAIVLLPALWAVGLAWQAVRAALLDPQRLAAGGADTGLAALAVLALCAAWLAALALAGVSSAIRAGLWSAEEARGRP